MSRVSNSSSLSLFPSSSSQFGQITSPAAAPSPVEPYTGDPAPPRSIPQLAASADSGAGAGRARDRISELPDDVLLNILSHLPLREAGRSISLSSRWRRLFPETLLHFDASQPWPPGRRHDSVWLLRAVSSILAAHPTAAIRSFRVVMFGHGFSGYDDVVAAWLQTLADRRVHHLDFFMLWASSRQHLPTSLLHVPSLITLKATNCVFPDASVAAPHFTNLQELDLCNVYFSDASLHAIFSHCVALETVKLKNVQGISRICLSSPSIKNFLGDFDYLDELLVEDAPNLERLVGIRMPDGTTNLRVIGAPKLQMLGYLGISLCPLVLGDIVFNGGIVRLGTLMYGVKTLAIQVPFSVKGHANVVAQWLRLFPRLEALSVKADGKSVHDKVDLEQWDSLAPIECLDRHLKKVVFENYGGQECQQGLAKFFLATARVLEVFEFYCIRCCSASWARNQGKLLCLDSRASSDARFLFFEGVMPVNCLNLCHCFEQQCRDEQCRLNRKFPV